MITNDFRPQTFRDIAGQDLNIRILKSIVKSPEDAPRSLIFQGEYGTGKTTSARVFARALNCDSNGTDPCLKCPSCTVDLESSPFYYEYDAAVVGNVDEIRKLRDTFQYSMAGGYRVIVFDEIHLASRQAQSALLKVIEEAPSRVFFIFATTEIDQIIPTIRSRSLELRYERVPVKDVIDNLKSVCNVKQVEVSDDILEMIALRSRGHMRNAHMYLDKYLMIGEEDFRLSTRSAKEDFFDYFLALSKGDKQGVFNAISQLITHPLADLKVDFQQALLDLVEVAVEHKTGGEKEREIISLLGANTLKVIKQFMATWVLDSFESDLSFQACFLGMFQLVSNSINTRNNVRSNTLIDRAKKK